MIELHSMPTPNGQKIMIMLEETGLPWKHIDVNIRTGDQFSASHLKISPNNKIPAIVDPDGPGGRYTMMESGAILVYLADKTGRFLASDGRQRYDELQWLFFQMASIGPMFGQAGHFNTQAKDPKLQYARDRYNNEAVRLYKVLDNRLRESRWLGSDDYSIADIATYPWTKSHADRGISDASHPHFIRWFKAMEARPAVQRNNALAAEIRERMSKAAEGKPPVNIYDTLDNGARLAQATATLNPPS
jgi:GSH-dependent disulfide-bond oxidoreductase